MNKPYLLLIPKGLPTLLCANSQLRKDIATFLILKALEPGGRFHDTIKTLKTFAPYCGYKGAYGFLSLKKQLYRLEQRGLVNKKTDDIYLISWDKFLEHFNLPGTITYKIYVNPERDIKGVAEILFEIWNEEEKLYFEQCRDFKFGLYYDLQLAAQSVCGSIRIDDIRYSQLRLFCKSPFKPDDEVQYLLLYARSRKGGSFYKADSHVSIRHLATRAGFKSSSGMSYHKKLWLDMGYITSRRRECILHKGMRTTEQVRDTHLGRHYFDPATRQSKLRLVDEVRFLHPWKKPVQDWVKKPEIQPPLVIKFL